MVAGGDNSDLVHMAAGVTGHIVDLDTAPLEDRSRFGDLVEEENHWKLVSGCLLWHWARRAY